jgi:flagellar hook assembly protein FlgD
MTPTNTPLTYPYNLVIEAYNEAGEKVKLIAQEVISTQVKDFETMVGNTLTGVFNPAEADLNLRFPGIWTGGTINVPYVDFAWDGTNANGQNASQGVYYIKVLVTDEYGHTDTIIKEVQLLRTEEYVRVSIYNSAGELVRRMQQDTVPGTQISLEVDDVFHVNSDTSNSTTIKLGGAGTMQWDGKNSLGSIVDSGIYEVSVELKDKSGFTVYSTKTITVLNETSGPVISALKAYPNPVVIGSSSSPAMRVQWTSAATGKVVIRFYNTAGELVSRLDTKIENLFVDWGMTTPGGANLAPGFYAAVIEAVSDMGITERVMIKLAIIRQ